MVDSAGGRSQVSNLSAAAMVLLVLLFLTGPLSHLPNAVLASIVFMVGAKLIDWHGLGEIRRKARGEFALAMITGAMVVCAGVEQGIILALVLSLLQHVRRSYQPHTAVIMHDETDHWRMEKPEPGTMILPGLVMYWFGAELFYANSAHFVLEARKLAAPGAEPVKWLVVDTSAITAIDFSAGESGEGIAAGPGEAKRDARPRASERGSQANPRPTRPHAIHREGAHFRFPQVVPGRISQVEWAGRFCATPGKRRAMTGRPSAPKGFEPLTF